MSSIGSNPPPYTPPYTPPKDQEDKAKTEETKKPDVIEGWPPHVHFGD